MCLRGFQIEGMASKDLELEIYSTLMELKLSVVAGVDRSGRVTPTRRQGPDLEGTSKGLKTSQESIERLARLSG